MQILYIAPLPPPLTGHSLVSQVFFDHLKERHQVKLVNFNKDSFVEGLSSFKRVFEVIDILRQVRKGQRNADVIYLTISESFLGNLKDLVIYLLCYKKLNCIYIHLHGGSIKKLLWDKNYLLFMLNKKLIKNLGGVIITGESHNEVFQDFVSRNNLYIVPNFAQDYLFISDYEIEEKYLQINKIKILFVSNMIEKKGYLELTNAFIKLNHDLKEHIQIDFAGKFETEKQENDFLSLISSYPNLFYHGVVENEKKKKLFNSAHVFALPTGFFEGQPVSILEAYASGCFVITTGQNGILDIFTNNINGYQFADLYSDSIKEVLEKLILSKDLLKLVSLRNLQIAKLKYNKDIFNNSMTSILEKGVLDSEGSQKY
jgi:glycosyltransferase involved in cell wall biosynthesis